MQFSDTTNKLGLIQACERYTNLGDAAISGNAALLKEFTAHINEAGRRVWTLIFKTYGGWQYDDSNKTDLPQAAANLVSGTSKYALPSEALTVNRVEIKDPEGNWVRLAPFTVESEEAEGLGAAGTGMPTKYRLTGTTLEFFPTPDYSQTNGYKVYFDRDSVDFASTDTTKTPGFVSTFHNALAVDASCEWTENRKPGSANAKHLADKKARYEQEISDFYAARWSDLKPKIKPKAYNWK